MKFRNTYDNLEEGRDFYTIWMKLPEEAVDFIHEFLQPIKDDCVWTSTFSKNKPRNTPHITLRYLAYKDELNEKNIEKDVDKFKEQISKYINFKLCLGSIYLFASSIGFDDGRKKLTEARISWWVENYNEVGYIHEGLLKVEGYDFFTNLEWHGYRPHISLGELDVTDKNKIIRINNYLDIKENLYKEFVIKDFEINLINRTIPLFSENEK